MLLITPQQMTAISGIIRASVAGLKMLSTACSMALLLYACLVPCLFVRSAGLFQSAGGRKGADRRSLADFAQLGDGQGGPSRQPARKGRLSGVLGDLVRSRGIG